MIFPLLFAISTKSHCKSVQNPVYLQFTGFFVFVAFLQKFRNVLTELYQCGIRICHSGTQRTIFGTLGKVGHKISAELYTKIQY
jgi:hypothetical protein